LNITPLRLRSDHHQFIERKKKEHGIYTPGKFLKSTPSKDDKESPALSDIFKTFKLFSDNDDSRKPESKTPPKKDS